jgi:hypothetical protein
MHNLSMALTAQRIQQTCLFCLPPTFFRVFAQIGAPDQLCMQIANCDNALQNSKIPAGFVRVKG